LLQSSGEAKLIDFGLAAYIGSSQGSRVGTAEYMAPELGVLAAAPSVAPALDLWSVGVVLHALLCGELLPRHVRVGLTEVKVAVGGSPRAVSTEAQDLLANLLQADPDARLPAVEAAAHPWCAHEDGDAAALRAVAGGWRGFCPLSRSLARALARLADEKALRKLLVLSRDFGHGSSAAGRIPAQELSRAASRLGAEGEVEEFVAQALRHLDADGFGWVELSDWVALLDAAVDEASRLGALAEELRAVASSFTCGAIKKTSLHSVDESTCAPTPCSMRTLDVISPFGSWDHPFGVPRNDGAHIERLAVGGEATLLPTPGPEVAPAFSPPSARKQRPSQLFA